MTDWTDDVMRALESFSNSVESLKRSVAALFDSDNADPMRELQQALRIGSTALQTADIAGMNSVNVRDAASRLRRMADNVGRVSSLNEDLDALADIVAASRSLDRASNGAEKAAAFDRMFRGISRVVSYFPPPINQWARFFGNAGNFFTNMERSLVPGSRGGQWSRYAR
ncbi:MAG: hypothetical protein ABJP70_02310 [Erythrobacter sp.]